MKHNNYFIKLFTVTLFLISAACFGQLKTVVQFGHKNPMTEIVISNDSKIIASTDGEVIKLWDIKTGLEFKTLFIGEGRIYPITNIQFVPGNSSYVLSYFFNRKLIYQNVLTSEVEIHNEDLKDQKDTLTKQEKLEIKFADRNTNVKRMDEYLSELAKIEENSLEIWEKFNEGVSYSDITFSENGKCKLTKRIGKFEKKEVEPYEDKSKEFKSLNSKLDPPKKKNKVEYTGRKYPYVIVPQENETKTILDRSIFSICPNEEIAKKFDLSKRTIDSHRQNILSKLQVKNTAGLIKYAIRLGLV